VKRYRIIITVTLVLGVAVCAFGALGDPPELRKLRRLYKAQIEKVEEKHRKDVEEAPRLHIQELETLQKQYQMAGDLKPLIAVRKERERFTADPSLARVVPVKSPAKLRALQMQYLEKHKEMSRERAKSILELAQKYVRRLGSLQKDLTQEDRIDEALKVMKEIEQAKVDSAVTKARDELTTKPPAQPGKPRDRSSMRIDTASLEKIIHGEITGWNPMTGAITCKYDFNDKDQLRDWEGGTHNSRQGRIICRDAPARLRLVFTSVSRVEYEGFFASGEEGIKMAIGEDLTTEIGAGPDMDKLLAYQDSPHFPLTILPVEFKKFAPYVSVLVLRNGVVDWKVNERNLKKARLRKPITYPTRIGFGSGSRIMFDNVVVQGVLSTEYVDAALKGM